MSSGDPKTSSAPPRVWLIGGASTCDVVVAGETVSRRHCRLVFDHTGYTLEDLNSSNGTYVNGVRIRQTVKVQPGQPITLGRHMPLPWDVILDAKAAPVPATPQAETKVIRVGRNPDNEIVLDTPAVSSHHARIIFSDAGAPVIEDLGSVNGTALNHVEKKIRKAPLSPADWVFFGAYKMSGAELLKLAGESHAASPDPPARQPDETDLHPEIASVFFTDIVGFTTLNPEQQMKARLLLEKYVQASPAFQTARQNKTVIIRPTGDGMALVFFTHPSDAAGCAVEVARMIAKENMLPVRMGIHQGTVYRLRDMNGSEDVNGRGINMAQRVMDGADCGEICISASVAEALRGTMEWHERIRPVGLKRIKHGESIEVFCLCGPDFGKNPQPANQ